MEVLLSVGQSRIQRAWWIQGLGYHSKQNDLAGRKADGDSHGKDGRHGRVDEHAGMFCSAFEKQGNQAPGMGSRIKLGRFCRLGKQPPIARKQTCWAGQRRPSQRSETCSVWPHGAGRRAVHSGRPRRRRPPKGGAAGPQRFKHAPWARSGQPLVGQLSDGGRARELVIAKKTLLKKTLLGYVFVTAVGAWSAATGASPDAGPCARPIRFGGHRAAAPAAQPAKGTRATEPVRDRAGRVGRRPTVGLGTMPVYLFW